MDKREQLISAFYDTLSFCMSNNFLCGEVGYSKTRTCLYEAHAYPELDTPLPGHEQRVTMMEDRTFEAAIKLHKQYPDKKITVLNFASATNPGGGVQHGTSAQEESLCRCSTLYPTLDQTFLWDLFYDKNYKARNPLYTDAIIYSPDIVICKTDDSIPKRMPEKDFVTVDVISCAAPNLRRHPGNRYNRDKSEAVDISDTELLELHKSRAKHILHIAAVNHADILILGAFGCGAFQNDPRIVAQAYAEVLPEYRKYFDLVIFTIHCQDGQKTPNFKAFAKALRPVCEEK